MAVSTLVMAGSLAQVPTVEGKGESPEGGEDGAQWNRRRFRFLMGALHVGCRLISVSCTEPSNIHINTVDYDWEACACFLLS